MRKDVLLISLFLLLILLLISCSQPKYKTITVEDSSLRHLVPQHWRETTIGMKVVTLRPRRGRQLSLDHVKASEQLDQIKAQGFQAIEIYAPAEGLSAYGGLDTKNHYRIDPELGTMDDFRRLVRLTHSKGLAIIVFINIGYFSIEAPDWIEACKSRDSKQAKWFSWSDRPDADPPAPEDTQFYVTNKAPGDSQRMEDFKTWGWQYSELAGRYYWSRWRAKDKDGNYVGLPQTNWASEEWPKEAERIVRFWMDTGIDGMMIDAPLFYTGLTWEKNNRHISDVIASYGNTYIQPEGGRFVGWITEGGYNSIQDYGMMLGVGTWEDRDWENSLITAIKTGDPRSIEKVLRNYHDIMVAARTVVYYGSHGLIRFEDLSKRHLERATVSAIGGIIAYGGRRGDPDAEETWILQTAYLHPALHPLSARRKLETNADDKYYAFLKTAVNKSERILVVLNFQATPQAVEVDLSGVDTAGLVELKYGELVERQSPFKVELPAYGYRFYQVLSAK